MHVSFPEALLTGLLRSRRLVCGQKAGYVHETLPKLKNQETPTGSLLKQILVV